MDENSPTFQGWDRRSDYSISPEGTAELDPSRVWIPQRQARLYPRGRQIAIRGQTNRTKSPAGKPVHVICERGTFLPPDGRTVLLWTQGNAPNAALDGKNFYKEGKSIPEPLRLKRFADTVLGTSHVTLFLDFQR
jgi:hypothetical protein